MPSRPGPRWTADRIPDLTGRVAVVTGANSGLGWHTALELARHGAYVVMACRDEQRGADAVRRVQEQVPGAAVVLGRLDLADQASVADFAGRLLEHHADGINLLVNNAGVMAPPRRSTVDGFELQLATNHLGHRRRHRSVALGGVRPADRRAVRAARARSLRTAPACAAATLVPTRTL